MSAAELARRLGMAAHPEGGFYRETYRAPGPKPILTSILFLLPADTVSRLHRIKSDELWYFHEGGPLVIAEIAADGRLTETTLGPGHAYQHTVRGGTWFGSYPAPGTAYALVGCAVAPGFDFADFELAERAALTRAFPAHAALIERLA